MKKKILALTLCVAMVAIAVAGATLAYFTDADQNTNEFAVGNVKIDLYETVDHEDGADVKKPVYGDGNELTDKEDLGKGDDTNPNVEYKAIMPGDTMTKIATVENTGANEAYIALVVKNDNYLNFNQKVDDYYEAMTAEEIAALGLTGADKDAWMQEITDDVWSGEGWQLRYTKPGANDLRYEMTGDTGVVEEGVEILGYGYANSTINGGEKVFNYSGAIFKEEMRYAGTEMEGNFDTINTDHTRLWVIYLKVDAGKSFTVDLTTTCPAYFDNDSTVAFEGMGLDIKAFAIQTSGFATAKDAFAEVFKEGFAY